MHEIDPNRRYRLRSGQPAEVFMIDDPKFARPVIGAGLASAGNWFALQWDRWGFTISPQQPQHTDLIQESDDDHA